MAPIRLRILFTDLDGTCVHYPPWQEWCSSLSSEPDAAGLYPCTSLDGSRTASVLRLPPSTSGAQGVISADTLRLYAALRQLGVRVVVVTGARSATLLARLPSIPAADAFVCEGGGRLFYPAAAANGGDGAACLPTAAPLVEDLEWRRAHAAAGPPGQDSLPPAERAGELWRFYAELQAAAPPGLFADAASYTTAFRVKGPADVVAHALRDLPPGLATAVNLGAADVFPATSGKESAARYLMSRWGAAPADCAFMCDDDNDLGLAHLVGRAFLPGITADTVQAAVDREPSRFYVAAERGVFGAEECLRLLVSQQLAAAAPAGSGAAGLAAAGRS